MTVTRIAGRIAFTFSPATDATSVSIVQSANGTDWVASNVAFAFGGTSSTLDSTSTGVEIMNNIPGGATYQFKIVVVGGIKDGDSNIVSVSN